MIISPCADEPDDGADKYSQPRVAGPVDLAYVVESGGCVTSL